MSKTLSNVSEEATEKTNVPNELTPILAFQPQDGLLLKLLNEVNRGEESGIPIAAKLRDADGNDLPLNTCLAIEFETPADTKPTVVSEVREDIEPYRQLSLQQMRKDEYIDATKINLKGEYTALTATDLDRIIVSIDSSTQIDWSNSRFSFNENAVRELSEE